MKTNNKYQLKEPKALISRVNIGKDLIYKEDFNVNSWFLVGHFESEGHVLDYLYNGDCLSLWFTIEDGKETAWATVLHPDGIHAVV